MTNSIEFDSDGNGEHADMVVCRRLTSPLLMPDNLIDLCAKCGEAIQHRPHVPKRPPKVCLECVSPLANKAAAKGELHSILTPEAVCEIAAHLRKKNAN
jgi:hypothetical protein